MEEDNFTFIMIRGVNKTLKDNLTQIAKEKQGVTLSALIRKELKAIAEKN